MDARRKVAMGYSAFIWSGGGYHNFCAPNLASRYGMAGEFDDGARHKYSLNGFIW